jgi:hypothetical protein
MNHEFNFIGMDVIDFRNSSKWILMNEFMLHQWF